MSFREGTPVMIVSLLRALLIATILAFSFALALFVGLVLAEAGMLGTCQDGACQLVAAVYVMPFGGIVLFVAALVAFSLSTLRRVDEFQPRGFEVSR